MSKVLVAYFSGTGRTARMAQRLAEGINADMYAIEAAQPYTEADLDYTNKKSRTTIECDDPSARPALAHRCETLDEYDTIFLGMPIWWFNEAPIIRTFLEEHSWDSKTIIPFVTSGSSGYGNTSEHVKSYAPHARVIDGKRLRSADSVDDLSAWAQSLLS